MDSVSLLTAAIPQSFEAFKRCVFGFFWRETMKTTAVIFEIALLGAPDQRHTQES